MKLGPRYYYFLHKKSMASKRIRPTLLTTRSKKDPLENNHLWGYSRRDDGSLIVYNLKEDPDSPYVVVKESSIPGSGLGLFVGRDFKNNEFIGKYIGFVMDWMGNCKESSSDKLMQQYTSISLGEKKKFVCDGGQAPQDEDGQRMALGLTLLKSVPVPFDDVDIASYPGMHGHMINDAKGENRLAGAEQNCIVYEDGAIHATRDVSKGDELFYAYNLHTTTPPSRHT